LPSRERTKRAGAEPAVVDGLDREAVIAAVRAAAPEVIVHQMTALAELRSLRRFDRAFAAANELRTSVRGASNARARKEFGWKPMVNVLALETADGTVRANRSVVNPDKLRHLGPVSGLARLPAPGPSEERGA
jgi:hypothetical protein